MTVAVVGEFPKLNDKFKTHMKPLLDTNIFVWALCIFVSVGARADATNLSEQQLLEFANQKYEKEKFALTKVTLGKLNGFSVVADYICSDLCPDHTVRVIHIDHPPEKACADIGGVEVAIAVPSGIGIVNKKFCVPKALAGLQSSKGF